MMSSRQVSSRSFLPREAWVIMGYLLGTLSIGAALAPWLYFGTKGVVAMVQDFKWKEMPVVASVYPSLVKADFTRVFNRAMLIAALVCLWPAFKLLRRSEDARPLKERLGLSRNPHWWWQPLLGFILGAGLLLTMGFFYVKNGVYVMRPSPKWGEGLRMAFQRGIGVGLIEELFFRALLLGLMLRASSERTALLFVTTLFAIVHFLQAPEALSFGAPYVFAGTGFWLVGEIFATFLDAKFLLAEFCTLWVAGFILGWARLRTKSLWLSIGLHAGWVWGISMFATATRLKKGLDPVSLMPWIGDDLKTGLIPLAVLTMTGGLVWLVVRKMRSPTSTAGS